MVDLNVWTGRRGRLALSGAALLALGAAGGAGAAALARPRVEMAPATATPIAALAQRQGIVTVGVASPTFMATASSSPTAAAGS